MLGGWARGVGGLVAGLWVGRPVGVLLSWAVIAVAAPWPMVTQPPLAARALTHVNVTACYLLSVLLIPSSLWNTCGKELKDKLQKIQNHMGKVITSSLYREFIKNSISRSKVQRYRTII